MVIGADVSVPAKVRTFFASLDTDGDGAVSFEEFLGRVQHMQRARAAQREGGECDSAADTCDSQSPDPPPPPARAHCQLCPPTQASADRCNGGGEGGGVTPGHGLGGGLRLGGVCACVWHVLFQSGGSCRSSSSTPTAWGCAPLTAGRPWPAGKVGACSHSRRRPAHRHRHSSR
jgi:hypothetical protein